VHAIAFTARQRADFALLLRALEVEPRYVRARRNGPFADHQLVFASGNFLPHALVRSQRVAALIHIAGLHGLTESQRARVRAFLPGDHAEQGGLPRSIRSDHADDAAARQREREIVHQQQIAVRLPHAARFDDDVTETRAGRNVDLDLLDLLRGIFVEQLLVRVETRLALGLARSRRHPNPFELALQCLLPLRLRLLFERQTLLLLIQPRRVIALPGNAGSAIELEDPLG